MDAVKELEKRDARIRRDKELIEKLKEEIEALKQLLDCAAANIAILVGEDGGVRKISGNDVKEALGKYRLQASRDSEGYYILEVKKEKDE